MAAEGLIEAFPQHLVLMSVQHGQESAKTVRIATCINGAVSKRIAELLDKEEGQ